MNQLLKHLFSFFFLSFWVNVRDAIFDLVDLFMPGVNKSRQQSMGLR